MDALTGLLHGARARGAFLVRSVLDPPWSLLVRDRAPLTVLTPVRGEAWVVPEAGEAALLRPGGVALVRGPEPYRVASAPELPPTVVIHPGDRSTTVAGEELCERLGLGVRSWGGGSAEGAVLVTGTYHADAAVSRRLLAALPAVAVVPAEVGEGSLVSLLGREVTRDEPGQEVFLDRLLDLVVVSSVRAWFTQPGSAAPGWYSAAGDPVVGPALRLLHDRAYENWTVATLAAEVGVSRATLARRFTELVGEPPMSYLTDWRLSLAADLLRGSTATLEAVARRVGYGSAFALSTAFRRERGVSPREYRRAGGRAAG
ncbi:AraC family transcriptional regulator [Actinoalloteichus sp. AHMU CJ021]|uniref:AraC family transcriptional regulator n=1 Tax=Actinoalloteichus sp. AHMU CJ021 TaxID=2072503 RepID=UPI000CA07C7C|nr:AraC family transcriptional regulator [Actinoalloteichus sp. AHMU CJ021]